MKKDPRVYLANIFECIGRIQDFTKDGKNDFFRNEWRRMLSFAILR